MDPVSPQLERTALTAQSPQERPKLRRGLSAVRISDDKGSVHTYNEEEKQGLVDIVNDLLKDDPHLRDVIPINPATPDIFDLVNDGVLLCKLVNTIRPGTIEPNKINSKSELLLFEKLENLTQAVNGAQIALNMPLVNIGVNDLLEGKPVLVLAVLWQLINLYLHTQVAQTAKIVRLDYLLKDEVDKSTDDEQLRILLRWFNHHLKEAKHNRRVSNLGSDIRDSENYIVLLHQLAPKECSLEALNEPDLLKRATLLLEQAALVGCKKFLGPTDIVQGNSRLNFAFLANLFTKFQRPPSPPPEVVKEKVVAIPEKERIKIAEEKKKIQDEVKMREIQRLQRDIVIAKELMNLPSVEVLQEKIIKEEKETAKIQLETEKLQLKVVNLTAKAEESKLLTKKVEEDTHKTEQEVTNMVVSHEKEVSHLKAKLDDGAAKVANLQKRLDEAVAQSTQLVQTKKQLAEEKVVLEEKIEVQQKDTSRLSRMKQKLESEITNTKKELTRVQSSRTIVEVAITKIEKQIQEINNEIVDINKSILKTEHYTTLAKEDLEQEQERVAIVQKEKTRLIARKSELEEEMYELQEKLQKEEEKTQNALREEKEKGKEEYTKLVLQAERELADATYKKEMELHANVDALARKEAAKIEKVIVKTQADEKNAELKEISRQMREANSEMLLTEKRNMKLENFVERAHKRNEDNKWYNEIQDEKLQELLLQEKEAKQLLLDRKAAVEAVEFKTNTLNKQMENMRERTIEAELAAAKAEREARSLKLEIDVISTLPEELNRRKVHREAMKEYDNKIEEVKDEFRHEKEMQRLNRNQEVKEREKETALTLLKREEERVKILQKEKEELEAKKEAIPTRRPKIVVTDDEDIDALLAKANAILQE